MQEECIKQGLTKVITNTTRSKRSGEKDDAYNFISEKEFKDKIEKDELLEYEIYGGNYYGISKDSIKDKCVVVVEPRGYKTIKDKYGEKVFGIYLEVEENEKARRLRERGENLKQISKRTLEERELFTDEFKDNIDLILKDIKLDKIEKIVSKNIGLWLE